MPTPPSAPLRRVTIYTDGGCQGNPGPGGWGAVLLYKQMRREISGGTPATTNNRMELLAAVEALRLLKESCEVELFTDSAYVQNGITKWIFGWRKKGWKTAEGDPVKNSDLWNELDGQARRHSITWKWLKGHAGHKENERCDELAGREMDRLRQQYNKSQLAGFLADFKLQQC